MKSRYVIIASALFLSVASIAQKNEIKAAEKALKAGIDVVTFDRGGYLYHGRIKSLAEGARAAGLKF